MIILLSCIMILGSIIAVVFVIISLPENYLFEAKVPKKCFNNYPLVIIKNLLGILIFITGVILLFLPGQGLLLMLIAVILADFPGKIHLLKWLFSKPGLLNAVNSIRERFNKRPLIIY